jgi:hypothetical protein
MKNNNRFLIVLGIVFLLISLVLASTTITETVENRDIHKVTITTTDANSSVPGRLTTLDLYGIWLRLGVELSTSGTVASPNNIDLVIRDEFDTTLISDTNVTDGLRYSPVSYGADTNDSALGIPVAGPIDVNWSQLEPNQVAKFIFWYKSGRGW